MPALQVFTFSANLSDYNVYKKFSFFLEMFTIIKVLDEPSKYFCNTNVNLLFRYGMNFSLFANAFITSPKDVNDLFILYVSFNLSPSVLT